MSANALWTGKLLEELEKCGQSGTDAVRFLRERRIRIGIRRQSAGARWTLWRTIELSPRYVQGSSGAPYALSLVVHEIRHIKQGPATALSVYGELEAWHVQFTFLLELTGGYGGVPGQAGLIKELLALPLGWDRSVLRTARLLMRKYAGRKYRVDLLPLYPLQHEVMYRLARRRPG